jgi:methionyl-tRNA formyltransferase
LLLETIRRIKQGSLTPRAQDDAQVSFAPIIKKADGLIEWSRPATEIERRVRGFNPWPSAYTYFRGKLMKVHRAKVVATPEIAGSPGEIVRADNDGLWVAAGSGTLSLEEVQLENRIRLAGVAFVRGARIQSGERLQSGHK